MSKNKLTVIQQCINKLQLSQDNNKPVIISDTSHFSNEDIERLSLSQEKSKTFILIDDCLNTKPAIGEQMKQLLINGRHNRLLYYL
jgi:mannose-1-phosphate guanylyltransferase